MFKILIIIALFSSSISLFSQKKIELIPYKKANFWGYSNPSGEIKIEPIFDTLHFFDSDVAKVKKDTKTGYIKPDGSYLVNPIYDYCTRFEHNHFIVRQELQYGLIHFKTQAKTEQKYDQIESYKPDLFQFKIDDNIGILAYQHSQDQYKELFQGPFEYIHFHMYKQMFICQRYDGGKESYDINGHQIKIEAAPPENQENIIEDEEEIILDMVMAPDFANRIEVKPFKNRKKQGLIVKNIIHKNGSSRVVNDTVPAIYDNIFYDNRLRMFVICQKGKWGIMDENQKLVLEIKYDSIDLEKSSKYSFEPYPQRFYVQNKEKWGIVGNTINKSDELAHNTVLIALDYDSIQSYFKDYALVKLDNFYGLISIRSFKQVTDIAYLEIVDKWIYSPSEIALFKVKNQSGDYVFVGSNGVKFFSE